MGALIFPLDGLVYIDARGLTYNEERDRLSRLSLFSYIVSRLVSRYDRLRLALPVVHSRLPAPCIWLTHYGLSSKLPQHTSASSLRSAQLPPTPLLIALYSPAGGVI